MICTLSEAILRPCSKFHFFSSLLSSSSSRVLFSLLFFISRCPPKEGLDLDDMRKWWLLVWGKKRSDKLVFILGERERQWTDIYILKWGVESTPRSTNTWCWFSMLTLFSSLHGGRGGGGSKQSKLSSKWLQFLFQRHSLKALIPAIKSDIIWMISQGIS